MDRDPESSPDPYRWPGPYPRHWRHWHGSGWHGSGRPGRGWPGRGPGHRRRLRLVMVLVVGLIQWYGTAAAMRHRGTPEFWGLTGERAGTVGSALLVLAAAALLLRARYPRVALVCAVAPTAGYYGLGFPDGPAFLAAVIMLFAVVGRGHRRFAWATAGAGYAGFLALAWPHTGLGRLATVGVWTLVAVGFAEAARVRAAHFAEVARAAAERQRATAERQRAQQEHERAQEERRRARDEQTRRQASEERLRIAQELHDVIGHHLSLINVQASVGLHLMADRPEQARESLAAIKLASAEALRETRAVLATLHSDGEAPRGPAPGLADLERLVADATAAGLPVELRTAGPVRPVPPEVDRAAYRIVREALTNVRRHAGPVTRVAVAVEYGAGEIAVTVRDDGATGAVPSDVDGVPVRDGGGSGIAGMRERAAALGGEVVAGPRPEGGFEVRARLPSAERREGP